MAEQYYHCVCSNADCLEFHKIVEWKDTGIAIYKYVPQKDDPVHDPRKQTYIIRNKKDAEVTPSEVLKYSEHNTITCPRCMKFIKKAENFIKNIPTIEKNDVMGVCDHCTLKQRNRNSQCRCKEIVRKFMSRKGTVDYKHNLLKLTKLKKALNNVVKEDEHENLLKVCSDSDLSLHKVHHAESYIKDLKFKHQRRRSDLANTAEKPDLTFIQELLTKAGSFSPNSSTESLPSDDVIKLEQNKINRVRFTSGNEMESLIIELPDEKPSLLGKSLQYLGEIGAEKDELFIVTKRYHSVESIVKSFSDTKKTPLKTGFCYFFPRKPICPERKLEVSSSELMKGQGLPKKMTSPKIEPKEEKKSSSLKKIEEKPPKIKQKPVKEEKKKEKVIPAKEPKEPKEDKKKHDDGDDLLKQAMDQQAKEREERERRRKELEAAKLAADKKPCAEKPEIPKDRITQKKDESKCPLCLDSYIDLHAHRAPKNVANKVFGERVMRYKLPLKPLSENEGVNPLLFKSSFGAEYDPDQLQDVGERLRLENIQDQPQQAKIKRADVKVNQEPKGIIRYALSDRTFIDKGWTLLPTEKIVRKLNVYRMKPSHPELDWFALNKNKGHMQYASGERLAEIDENGRGRWYYKNGKLALDHYDAEDVNAQQRYVVYSSGEPDKHGRSQPRTVLATFDYSGNGVVFDHGGKIRLKYNQTEGVVLDREIGPVSHWKWHTLNDPPVLQKVMIDTQMSRKDPRIMALGTSTDKVKRPDNEDMLAIEFDNFIKEKSKKLSQKFKPFQIKMKALKINDNFSLKVLDQATVYLTFRDGSTNLKLNIGMVLDHQTIVDQDTADVGEVSNTLETFPARTLSVAGLQRGVANATRIERERVLHETRLKHPVARLSVDRLTAAASKPLRAPLLTTAASFTSNIAEKCKCKFRKSPNNIYYDNRLYCTRY